MRAARRAFSISGAVLAASVRPSLSSNSRQQERRDRLPRDRMPSSVVERRGDPARDLGGGDGRRLGAFVPDRVLHGPRCFQVQRRRQAMGDHGGFECDDGSARCQRIADAVGYIDRGVHGLLGGVRCSRRL